MIPGACYPQWKVYVNAGDVPIALVSLNLHQPSLRIFTSRHFAGGPCIIVSGILAKYVSNTRPPGA